MRALRIVVVVLAVAVALPAFGQGPPVQTSRDAKGVWFIEGGSVYDVFEAMGYAVATDRLLQMELLRRTARGTLSELVGAQFLGEDYLSDDIFFRSLLYSEDEYQQMFDALSPDAQNAIKGYVAGVNRRIGEVYANFRLLPYEYWLGSFFTIVREGLSYNIMPKPWTVNDVLAWTALLQRNFDGEFGDRGQLDNAVLAQTLGTVYGQEGLAMFHDLRWLNDPAAQTMIPPPPSGVGHLEAQSAPDIPVEALPDVRAVADALRERFEGRERRLKKIGIEIKMGSYAMAVSGSKTASGNPIIYSGPQMGFTAPAIVVEGSVRGGGLEVSGMTVPGIPGIIVGRTPHHAWSMQVGHAHTTDYFIEAPQSVTLHHMETIRPAGGQPVTFPVYRSLHGPIVNPFPYNPNIPPTQTNPIVAMAYSHWMKDAQSLEAFIQLARATSIAEFGAGIEKVAVSQHYCYADRDGNIAYWMSGYDPIRKAGTNPYFPQMGDGNQEWTGQRRPIAHAVNPDQGFFAGWNNKASADYMNPPNSYSYYLGPAHRAHVLNDYLSTHSNLTYEEVRDLALNIATTDSFGDGGNTWSFVKDTFKAAVAANPNEARNAAIDLLDAWDGHFVDGGPPQWRMGTKRADAWVLQDKWIREVMRLTFEDEFARVGMQWERAQPLSLSLNVLLHALAGPQASLPNYYNWFQDKLASGKPTTAQGIIVQALDTVQAALGLRPYNVARGEIVFSHILLAALDPLLGSNFGSIHKIPFSSRSTYAHCVEYGSHGPLRIESMFPLGESGTFLYNGTFTPTIDPNFFSMAPVFDPFMPRSFPLFE
jgi:penicillin amidase